MTYKDFKAHIAAAVLSTVVRKLSIHIPENTGLKNIKYLQEIQKKIFMIPSLEW